MVRTAGTNWTHASTMRDVLALFRNIVTSFSHSHNWNTRSSSVTSLRIWSCLMGLAGTLSETQTISNGSVSSPAWWNCCYWCSDLLWHTDFFSSSKDSLRSKVKCIWVQKPHVVDGLDYLPRARPSSWLNSGLTAWGHKWMCWPSERWMPR